MSFTSKRSSTSRHDSIYSSQRLIHDALEALKPYTVNWNAFGMVDFSAGDNLFIEMMRLEFPNKLTMTKSYDLVPNSHEVVQKDWFDVDPRDIVSERPPHLIIGFNPPFGFRCAFAKDFLHHACKFKPDVIISVVPNGIRKIELDNYIKAEQHELDPLNSYRCNGRVFGTTLVIWKRSEGLSHEKVIVPQLKYPNGIRRWITYKAGKPVPSWRSVPNTFFIRRSGANPGLKLLVFDDESRLHMIDPGGNYSVVQDDTTINNTIASFNAYTLDDRTKWFWDADSYEELLRGVWENFKALDCNVTALKDRKMMMPYLDTRVCWECISPFISCREDPQ